MTDVAQQVGNLEFFWGLEQPVAFVGGALALFGLVRFFPFGRNRALLFAPNPGLGLVRLSFLGAGAWFWWVLAHGADANVVGFYTLLYVAMAAACLFWGGLWRPILGLYAPADVVERGNLAAALVLAGFAIGTAFAFGGALTGNDVSCAPPRLASPLCQAIAQDVGPGYAPGSVGTGGWHVVLVFFLLAYIELRTNLTAVDRIGGGLSQQVRLDRDVSAGVLLAAVAISSGLVAGRAAAGDYVGWGPALNDYWIRLWPLLVIPFFACAVGFYTNGKASRGAIRGLSAVALIAGGAAWYVLS